MRQQPAKNRRKNAKAILKSLRVFAMSYNQNAYENTNNCTATSDFNVTDCSNTRNLSISLTASAWFNIQKKVKRLKLCIALHGKPLSELRGVTCHMGSEAGTRFTYPREMEG